jgi:hypothetical protein
MERQGYLKKNGDNRHCIVKKGEFCWAEKQFGKIKNGVSLKTGAYRLVRHSPTEIQLQPQPGRKDKAYTLVSTDAEDSAAWEVALKSWMISSTAADQLIAERGPAQRDASKMSGWLLKKGQRRWFFIEQNVLYWADKEVEVSSGTDFRKKVNGSMDISGDCTLTLLDDTSFEITSFAGANYALTASLPSEAKAWIHAIAQVLALHGMESVDALSSTELEHRGYLTKKGKTRFLLLKKNHVFWYAHLRACLCVC